MSARFLRQENTQSLTLIKLREPSSPFISRKETVWWSNGAVNITSYGRQQSQDRSVFSFLMPLHTDLHNGTPTVIKCSLAPFTLFFFTLSILTGVKWIFLFKNPWRLENTEKCIIRTAYMYLIDQKIYLWDIYLQGNKERLGTCIHAFVSG